ncbi:MAG: DUF4861 domain-containing protein [Cyclobacteriaceae bacterium]
MKNSFNLIVLAAIAFSMFACTAKEKAQEIDFVVDNPEKLSGKNFGIVIERSQIEAKIAQIPTGELPYATDVNGEPIPSQADDLNFDGEWDELAILLDLDAENDQKIRIKFAKAENYPDFPKRTNIRFAHKDGEEYHDLTEHTLPKDHSQMSPTMNYQMEGPAWENELAGYRTYFDPRNGFDIFGKKTRDMVMDRVGIDENYHEMQSWGMDVLKVGNSLGAGALALHKDGTLYRLGEVEKQTYRFISEGPVRALFDIVFEGWQVGDETIRATRRIEIWAGSHGFNSYITLDGFTGQRDLVTGVVNMKSDTMRFTEYDNGTKSISTFDKQTENLDNPDEYLGMALLVDGSDYINHGTTDTAGEGIINTYYVSLKAEATKPVKFAFVSAWEVQDSAFATEEGFLEALKKESAKFKKVTLADLE